MKFSSFLVIGILSIGTSYAFEIYNQTDADIYAVGQGHTSGLFDFGTIPSGQTSKSWRPANHGIFGNLPATVYICWSANTGCSYYNIMSSPNATQVSQKCEGGIISITGKFAPNTKPQATPNLDGKDC